VHSENPSCGEKMLDNPIFGKSNKLDLVFLWVHPQQILKKMSDSLFDPRFTQ
jgi:hypothetical protein